MDIDLARHVARTALRSARELGDMLPLLKQHLDAEEYKSYAEAISSAVDAIDVEILDKVMSDHQKLAQEIEVAIAAYGRYL
jgi:hypothetical protein